MTEHRNGRLYHSRGATHPEALPAIGEHREREVQLPAANVAARPRRAFAATWPAGRVYLLVCGFALAVALVDALALDGPGLVFSIGFAVASLAGALLAEREAAWAGWTAPPIALFAGLVVAGVAAAGGTGVIGIALFVLQALADRMWIVLAVVAATVFIANRRRVTNARSQG